MSAIFNMPTPVGTYDVLNMNPFISRVIDVTDKTLPDGKYNIYTAEALRDVLEQAAKVCEARALTWRVRPVPLLGYSAELENCADAIRALIKEVK